MKSLRSAGGLCASMLVGFAFGSMLACSGDRKSTRLNSSHTEIYTLSLHDALPIYSEITGESHEKSSKRRRTLRVDAGGVCVRVYACLLGRSEEHTSELQSHRDLHSFPTRRSSDLFGNNGGEP